MWQKFLEDYLSFTKKERSGIIALVFSILVVVLTSLLLPYLNKEEIVDHAEFKNEIAQLRADTTTKQRFKTSDEYYNDYSLAAKRYETAKAETFFFDPNTASLNDWLRLGIKEKTALTIQKYIAKGGRFYKPEDIRKIWGLHASDADRLIPFVNIKNVAKEYPQQERQEYPKSTNSLSRKTIGEVDVNLSDTLVYATLPGIGARLSQRIVAFREKLGGFYSIEQVSETYFLPDSTFQKIKPYLVLGNKNVKQINVNSATIDQMKSHPYIKYNLANAIFNYRKQHGNFKSVEELKKIMILSESEYKKIEPYLRVE